MTASTSKKPSVHLVSCTQDPLETILATWFNSRDEGPTWTADNLWSRLDQEWTDNTEQSLRDSTIFNRLMKEKAIGDLRTDASTLFYDILAMDVPVLEFITFQLSFADVPRSFVDQLDRTRTAAFWEQSVRVLDLSKISDEHQYFIPDEVDHDPKLRSEYEDAMFDIQESYKRLRELGLRPELARGVVPMHVNVRADCSISLRTLIQMIRKRACFFAQGAYWEPVIAQMIDIVCGELPDHERARNIFSRLPCDMPANGHACPYKRDIMDRLVDKSNPICPVLYTRELSDSERNATLNGMDDMYGLDKFQDIGVKYLSAVRPIHLPQFREDLEKRTERLGLSLRK